LYFRQVGIFVYQTISSKKFWSFAITISARISIPVAGSTTNFAKSNKIRSKQGYLRPNFFSSGWRNFRGKSGAYRKFFEEPISICQYYFAGNDFLSLSTGHLNYEEQKQNQQSLGREIKTSAKIDAEHFITMEENGAVGNIVLKISEDYFLAIDFLVLKVCILERWLARRWPLILRQVLINYLKTGKINKININP